MNSLGSPPPTPRPASHRYTPTALRVDQLIAPPLPANAPQYTPVTPYEQPRPSATLHVTVGGQPFTIPTSLLARYPDTLLSAHVAAGGGAAAHDGEVGLSLPHRCPDLFRTVILPFYDMSNEWDLAGAMELPLRDAMRGKIDRELGFYGLPSPLDPARTLEAVARTLSGDVDGAGPVLMDPRGWAGRCVGALERRTRWLDVEQRRCVDALGRLGELLRRDGASSTRDDAGDRRADNGADASPMASVASSPAAKKRRVSVAGPLSPPVGDEVASTTNVDLMKDAEGRYVCTTCARSFGRKNGMLTLLTAPGLTQLKPVDLKRHLGVHLGYKAHLCERCLHRFNRRDALIRHGQNCSARRKSISTNADGGEPPDAAAVVRKIA
ncbi:hypothetical protein HK101_001770 [Irineochytrium annulatum]|nr:hypothetical protein HK101_001770 [Irineochytrium annulatum]